LLGNRGVPQKNSTKKPASHPRAMTRFRVDDAVANGDETDVDCGGGTCDACGEQLEIVGVDDATLDIECTGCGEGATVEPDYFNDGGIRYWPEAMVEFGEEL